MSNLYKKETNAANAILDIKDVIHLTRWIFSADRFIVKLCYYLTLQDKDDL